MFVRIDPKKRLDLCDCIKVFIQAGNYAKALNAWARSAFGNAFYICAINHIYTIFVIFVLPQPKYYWQREPRPAASNLHYSNNSTQANLQLSLGDDDNDENYTQQHHHHSDHHQQQ